jgi:monofunctional chorismate mutase
MMQQLQEFRQQLDELDGALMNILEKRLEVCREIGEFKKSQGLEIFDASREEQIINSKIEKSNLSPIFIGDLFRLIMNESKRLQGELR